VLSPEVVAHRDQAAALPHLTHELSREVYRRGEVAALQACLAADGWHTMMPEGWKVRRTDGRPPQFLTRAGLCLETHAYTDRQRLAGGEGNGYSVFYLQTMDALKKNFHKCLFN
jgi:hypothetical protein